MTNQNNAAQAAEQDPLTDEYVNAVIRQHGYDSPETVIARLWQWIGLNGSENGVTLLMYEAHKALSKLRAEGVQAGDERAAFEASYRSRFNVPAHAGLTFPDVAEAWEWWQARAALASAPVAGKAQPTDEQIHRLAFDAGVVFGNTEEGAECWEFESPSLREFALALLSRHAAPQASEAADTLAIDLDYADDASVQIEVHGTERMLRRLEAWLGGERSRIREQSRNAALEEAARIADMYRDNVHEHIRALKTQAVKDGGQRRAMDSEELRNRVLSAIHDAADLKPEDDETWEEWYCAAFDLLGSRVGDIFRAALSATQTDGIRRPLPYIDPTQTEQGERDA